jgi:capsular exopolysaccharide synthesis family protein
LNQKLTEKSSNIGTQKNTGTFIQHPANNIKEYLNILRSNMLPIILVAAASIIVTLLYVLNAIDIYKTATTLKIQRPQGSILTAQLIPEIQDFQTDRYISNEIEIMKSNNMRERVAFALLDSIRTCKNKNEYYYIVNKQLDREGLISPTELTKILEKIVNINQKRGLDITEIEVQSPSSIEASLIANVYARAYLSYNIDYSRRELTNIKNFLEEEKSKKITDLSNSEAALQDYQQKGGVIFLDEQARNLVERVSSFEAEKNAADVELKSKQKAYDEFKSELNKIDIGVSNYVEGQINQPYIQELEKKIAELEVQKQIDLSIPMEPKLKERITNDYDKKINPLQKSYDERINIIRTGLVANTPQQKLEVSQKFLEVNIDIQATKTKLNSLSKLLQKYESEFTKLPSQSIELARLERQRKSNEKLYLALEEKYQEALINERAQLGNVNIVDKASVPTKPSKPNRSLILVIGTILGFMLGISFAFLRNYLDRSIKSPEEIENKGVSVLAWIPSIEELKELGSSQLEFIIANKPNATASESFKALRTRVLFSKLESQLRTILITSSIPGEGKTTVALNLSGSFALADKKVLLLDCDLRKPRIHAIFNSERFPGLSDYLFSNVSLEDITRPTKLSNLSYITSGTIPPNPSELLGSNQMFDFLEKLKGIYDIIILDSPPFISVTDPEILTSIADGTVLIIQANKTPMDAFMKSYTRISNINPHKFLGTVLNNFSIKSAYGYYYNYYYYYSRPDGMDKRRSKQVKKI